MLPQRLNIRGSIAPRNMEGITEPRTILRLSFGNTGVGKIFLEAKVTKHTVVEVESAIKVVEGRQTAMKFIDRLNTFVQADHVSRLGLEGSFTITFETGEEPVTIRVKVKDGKVAYQEAQLIWDSETIV